MNSNTAVSVFYQRISCDRLLLCIDPVWDEQVAAVKTETLDSLIM